MSNNIKLLLVGAGYMGKEYAKVLKSLNIDFTIITRTEKTAKAFAEDVGIKPIVGDLKTILLTNDIVYTHAINAVPVQDLIGVTKKLIEYGIKDILVEKPLGLFYDSIYDLVEFIAEKKVKIYVGYNRRYYASTKKAQEIINNDGDLLSINFEFTEWKNKIDFTKYHAVACEKWLVANSSHVIDLAFFFAGNPKEYSFYSTNNLFSAKDIFVGSGITDKDVFFSYSSNWDAPGRWGVELLTRKHRLYLKPMEKLYMQNLNSIDISEVALDDKLDLEYKPGVYNEVVDFLSMKPTYRLKTIYEQLNSIIIYDEILNGKKNFKN